MDNFLTSCIVGLLVGLFTGSIFINQNLQEINNNIKEWMHAQK